MRIAIKLALIAVALIVAVWVAGCSKNDTTSAPPVQTPQTPPAQVKPDKVGPATVIPKDKTPEQYVTEYYNAYKAKDFDKCYEMLPAINKAKEDKANFKSVRESMPITDFTVKTKTSTKDEVLVEASYPVSGQTWVIAWTFKNSKDGWIAEGYTAGMGQ